jgi:type 1 glutamine amidotransferase/predicted dehydrogenase
MPKNNLFFLFFLFATTLFAQKTRPNKHVLIFTKNAKWAYRHESIEAGKAAVKAICEKNAIKADTSENSGLFTDENLKKYSAIVFLSANQDVFDADQEAAFQRYIRSGGGFVGVHAASGVERNWKWFSELLGGTFQWHTPQQNAMIDIIDRKHISTKHFPKRWKHWDEWYYFGKMNPNLHVVAALDTTTFKSDRHTQHYPFSWYQEFEGGRSFYTAGGHNIADFSDKLFLQHILGGIQYAIGKNLELNPENLKKYEQQLVQIITLDPGHFHAALVQKNDIPNIKPLVHIYAPIGEDVKAHLKRIDSYNNRAQNPTHWEHKGHISDDFFADMLSNSQVNKQQNVVVMSGNNRKKTEYILKTIENGMNVLADKPMCIDSVGYEQLKKAFDLAKKNNVLLYDIMTERSEITTLLQKELSQMPAIFGKLEQGTPENPAVIKESVHHFFKSVSGAPLIRPAWFMDVAQQGEGIVDVTTHLVDLVQWASFPETPLAIKDVKINAAKRWATTITRSQFAKITNLPDFPAYLKQNVTSDSVLNIFSNGEINYALRGVNAKVRVLWNYSAPEGGDTHYSIMRGTKANVEIRQGKAENFTPQLYIKPINLSENELLQTFEALKTKYAGISLQKKDNEWLVEIPKNYRTGHEAHFGEVMERFLKYQKVNNLPDWEVPNMLLKYYITTKALEMAKK